MDGPRTKTSLFPGEMQIREQKLELLYNHACRDRIVTLIDKCGNTDSRGWSMGQRMLELSIAYIVHPFIHPSLKIWCLKQGNKKEKRKVRLLIECLDFQTIENKIIGCCKCYERNKHGKRVIGEVMAELRLEGWRKVNHVKSWRESISGRENWKF